MDRSDVLLVGLGGAGGNLVDTIVNKNPMFECLFINTSITDIQSLTNSNEEVENFYCISKINGVGRDRTKGKAFAKQRGLNILDTISRYNQKKIYLVTSFGGGSGSSILSVLTEGIDKFIANGEEFDKDINLIAILPSLDSSTEILQNTKDTWNEVMSKKCITSIIPISNNCITDCSNINNSEEDINNNFADIFDAIFDIPMDNGMKFDAGNLGNILNDKGFLYFYDLGDYSNIEEAMNNKDNNSCLAPIYTDRNFNIEIQADNSLAIKCGYVGVSFDSEDYNKSYIYKSFKNDKDKETYVGENADEHNILILSGMLPPLDTMTMLEHELRDRNRITNNTSNMDFSKFTIGDNNNVENNTVNENSKTHTKKKKRKLPKHLFI